MLRVIRDSIGEAKAHVIDMWMLEKTAEESGQEELAQTIRSSRESTERFIEGQETIRAKNPIYGYEYEWEDD